ncbi:hypothetical protein M378DRAFT_180172 [Amanita muscaria Koide BX008]|uniref:Copper transport protein n=1 Tax=Amanita muscaria (strain Koide BX008) TaxID=946122 RepID=A0A0C2WI35_AMAMK|nr:hypothetical protein M378DRAFT_180172 [Amanita muscaria Koide BX008]
MDHGHSGHGGHGDMPGMPAPTCSMHMLWNTQIIDTCIIFPSWHITSTTSFVFSFFAIVLLGVFYEYLRLVQGRVDAYIAQVVKSGHRGKRPLRSASASPVGGISTSLTEIDEDRELLTGRKVFRPSAVSGIPVPFLYRLLRASIYGSTVFLSFFLMLVFMTYNAYLILAVVLGAIIGNFKFGKTLNDVGFSNGKGMACH